MTRYIALLRAVNVGGTGKLPMADLRAICEAAGWARVETYIASGNVLFESKAAASKVKAELEGRLRSYAGKPIDVVLRTAAEMAAVLKAIRFRRRRASTPTPSSWTRRRQPMRWRESRGGRTRKMRLGKREIFVLYPTAWAAPSCAFRRRRPAPRAT
jgi:uncharacterized protein (DUF1697 family)